MSELQRSWVEKWCKVLASKWQKVILQKAKCEVDMSSSHIVYQAKSEGQEEGRYYKHEFSFQKQLVHSIWNLNKAGYSHILN